MISALDDVTSWLQSASQTFPTFQLSVITWVMFIISGRYEARRAFNVPEQSGYTLSKASLQ
jgi:hypothetical protein